LVEKRAASLETRAVTAIRRAAKVATTVANNAMKSLPVVLGDAKAGVRADLGLLAPGRLLHVGPLGDAEMKTVQTSWLRSLLLACAVVGVAIVTTGCDWANVGGPW
jgi:hypothetical protein